jgi:branched-chain amino acid aminotransferase
VEERSIDRTELYTADELFFCGTSAEVTPIFSVDRMPVGGGQVGPLTLRLRDELIAVARNEADTFGWTAGVYEAMRR